MTTPASRHVELASRLVPLREEGVLVLGSGNIVHNLFDADLANTDAEPDPKGVKFDTLVANALTNGDLEALFQPNTREGLATGHEESGLESGRRRQLG